MCCKRNNTTTFFLSLLFFSFCNFTLAQNSGQSPLVANCKSGSKTAKITYYVQYRIGTSRSGTLLYSNGQNKNDIQKIDLKNNKNGMIEVMIDKVDKMRNRHKFFIKDDCLDHPTTLSYISDEMPIVAKSNGDIKKSIRFNILENGVGEITIMMGTTGDNDDIDNKACNDGKIVIKYDITGMFKAQEVTVIEPKESLPEPVVNREKEDWDNVKINSIKSLCDFILSYPDGVYVEDAKLALKPLDDKLWEEALESGSITGFKNYKNQFRECKELALHYREAREKLVELPNKKKIAEEWDKFNGEDREEAIINFVNIAKYDINKKKAFNLLLENYPKIEYKKTELGDNKYRLEITNPYFNPRSKNISLNAGININHSSWAIDHSLIVDLEQNNEFKILIRDSLNREAIIPFGSTFDVKMESSDTAYVINILGGKTPYLIHLLNYQSGHQDSFYTSDENYILNPQELINAGFTGAYSVKVNYEGGPKAEELDQSIFLKKKRSYSMLIIGLLTLFAVSAFALFFHFHKKGKKNQETIFNN